MAGPGGTLDLPPDQACYASDIPGSLISHTYVEPGSKSQTCCGAEKLEKIQLADGGSRALVVAQVGYPRLRSLDR